MPCCVESRGKKGGITTYKMEKVLRGEEEELGEGIFLYLQSKNRTSRLKQNSPQGFVPAVLSECQSVGVVEEIMKRAGLTVLEDVLEYSGDGQGRKCPIILFLTATGLLNRVWLADWLLEKWFIPVGGSSATSWMQADSEKYRRRSRWHAVSSIRRFWFNIWFIPYSCSWCALLNR